MKSDGKEKPSGSTEGHPEKSETAPPDGELKRLAILAAVFVLALVIWFIPPPSGVEPRAWHLLAIFVATIVGIITKPLPMGAIALFGIAATALYRDAHDRPGTERLREQHHLVDCGRLFHFPRLYKDRLGESYRLPFYGGAGQKDSRSELRFDRDGSRSCPCHPQQHRAGRRDRLSVGQGFRQGLWQRARRRHSTQDRRVSDAGRVSGERRNQRDVSDRNGCEPACGQVGGRDAHRRQLGRVGAGGCCARRGQSRVNPTDSLQDLSSKNQRNARG